MWTLEEAVNLVRVLQGKLTYEQLAITGSVLYTGRSDKDLDIIVYPRSTEQKMNPEAIIGRLGLTNPEKCKHDEYDYKIVYRTKYKDGRRVDVFFLK